MMGERQNEVRAVFLEALALTAPEERARHLDAACRGKPELRQRVEALLRASERSSQFLKQDALGGDLDPPETTITEKPGTIIGHYKLLEQIGEGGFGVVFMAEQIEPIRRRVALKIVKPGMDTKQVIARFEAERQALAMMDHPNIAKIFDAGVTDAPLPASGHRLPSSDEGKGQGEGSSPATRHPSPVTHYGRPYFVMELVQGVPINQFCDANGLTPIERLKLFLNVCEAVQHAHQKGIIHRDLKPSNILVTLHDGKPVPKVIDFGTAKALQQPLTEKTLFTAYGKLIGTPQYMSPEQAELSGLDVDTRADIYSLGVLLYELLTGTTPFEAERLRSAAFDELLRIIRQEEPPKPSTRVSTLGERATEIAKHRQADPALLRRTLRGDLDWIVMKALEKDRARRYDCAGDLVKDIQHHLNHEPVKASPPGAAYRARKFIRRHRVGVTLAATVTMALIAGLTLSLLGFAKARRERDRAMAAEADAQRQRSRAEGALEHSQELLWQANFERAGAQRRSGMPGQRVQALAAIEAAAAVRPSPELRTEAVAVLALADLEDVGRWHELPPSTPLCSVAVDGRCAQYAVAGVDAPIEVRSLIDNTLIGRLTNAPAKVQALQFDRDGSRLAIEGEDRSLVWDVLHQQTLVEDPAPSCLAISEDGRHVLRLLSPTNLLIWDVDERRELARLETHQEPRRAVFTAEGRRLAMFFRTSAEVWSWRSGQKEADIQLPSGSLGLAWSNDGDALALGCEDGNLYLWRPPSRQLQKIGSHRYTGVRPCYHPGGELLASVAWDGILRLWDAATGMQWLQSNIDSPLRFSVDGQWLAIQRLNSVGRLRVHPAEVCRFLPGAAGATETPCALDFSPDSQFLAGLQPGQFMVWDLASRRLLWRQRMRGAVALQFLDSSRLLTAAAAGLEIWTNLGSPSSWKLSEPATVVRPGRTIRYLALDRDHRNAVLALDQDCAVFDLPLMVPSSSTGMTAQPGTEARPALWPLVEPRVRLLGQPGFHSVAITPDGQWIASGYWDPNLLFRSAMWFWSAADGRSVRQIPLEKCAPYFSPDGRWFLAMTLKDSRLYTSHGPPDQWREVWRKPRESAIHFMRTAAFSSDGDCVAFPVGQTDIRIVFTATGRELVRLTPPDPWIWTLAWSPDGRWLAGTSKSGTFLWDLGLLRTRLSEFGLDWE